MPRPLTLTKIGHDGLSRLTYSGELIHSDATVWIARCVWDGADGVAIGPEHLNHGDLMLEYYYPAQWFNILAVYEPAGRLKGWYCNIAYPPKLESDTIVWHDLALDLMVLPDGACHLLDEDEFAEMDLSAVDRAAALDAMVTLRGWVAERQPPFEALPPAS
jgi:hypothetical protein